MRSRWNLRRWVRSLFIPSRPLSQRRRSGVALWLEALEDRFAPATLTVNTTADTEAVDSAVSALDASGNISLRSAIERDNFLGGGQTIDFAILPAGPHVIQLGSSLPQITSTLTIQGTDSDPGAITIDGSSAYQIFNVAGGAGLMLADLTVRNGLANSGGGIQNSGTLTLTDCTLSGNSAASIGRGGGGIDNGGTATLTDCTLSGNSAHFTGGGIDNTGALTLTDCTLSGNSAQLGGGMLNFGTITLTNSTLSGNSASIGGGGILNGASGTLTVVNSTLVLNQATTGGGINNETGSVTLTNTIVAGNTASTSDNDLAGTVSGSHNLIGDPNSAGGLTNNQNGNILGNGSGGTLPIASIVVGTTPANNGGPTGTFALAANSPALNAGSNALAVDANNQPLTSDQRGSPFVRIYPSGGTVDIGAYEAQTLNLVVNTTSDALNPGAGLLSLREAITAADANPGADTITFDPSLSGQTITLGGTALPALSDSVTITGPSGGITVDANHASRILTVDSGVTADLSTLTLANGNIAGSSSSPGGGAIWNQGSLTLSGCTLSGNSVSGTSASGGAIFSSDSLALTDCTLSGNSASFFGGAIATIGTLTLTDCTLSGNTAGTGGGIANDGTLMLIDSTLSGNSADVYGGAIANSGILTLTNSTLSGNSAGQIGSGIANQGALVAVNDTIVLNSVSGPSAVGGAIGNISSGTATLSNSLVAGNTTGPSQTPSDILVQSGTLDGSYNLIGDPNSAGGLTTANHNILGNGSSGVEPIGSIIVGTTPANNGGPTATFALAANSPALDAGNNVLAVDAQGNPLQTDQRGAGFPRIVHFTVDIGAFESNLPLQPIINLANAHHFYVDSGGLFEDSLDGDEKWLRGDANSFGNTWYYILPNGDVFAWSGAGLNGTKLLNVGANAWENPELLVNATSLTAASPNQVQNADQSRAFFRSSFGDFYLNAFGGNEKWIDGMISAKAPANQNNPWYYIKPDGSVWEWDGTSGTLSGTRVASLTADVNLYLDPALLYDAYQNTAVNSGGQAALHHFYFDRVGAARNLWENWSGTADEKWFRGDLNANNNPWYFILPNGDLYAWDGKPSATGQVLAHLGADAWNDIERVVGDFQPGLLAAQTQQLVALDTQYSLFRASRDINYFFNLLGQQEKWLRGAENTSGNDWYFILPAGTLEAWNGHTGGTVLASSLPAAVYQDPLVLASAYADGAVLGTELNLNPFAPNSGGPGDRLG